jgi:hypothetical protein
MVILAEQMRGLQLRQTIRSLTLAACVAAVAGALAVGSASMPALARTACPAASQVPSVSVRVRPGSVVVNNGHSQDGLKRLQGQASNLRSAQGWLPVGLTSTELGFSMNVRVNAVPAERGVYCGFIDSVDASFGYDQLTVFIARQYRPGSCHYASIIEHEKTHVLVFRRLLDEYAPRLERRLTKAAHRMPPIVAADAHQAATHIKDRLRREVQPLFREMNRKLDRANASLDTPANYKLEQARCNGW